MVSFGLALVGGVSIFAVLRAKVQRLGETSEQIVDNLTLIKGQIVQLATMREVRQEFVSKEMFAQMQSHFDDKFNRLERGVNKILEKMEK